MYDYRAQLINIVDGDTLHLEVLLGCDVRVRMTVRLAGLDCPEISTETGRIAKIYVQDWFTAHAPTGAVLLVTAKDRREKYGRYLGSIESADGDSLNAALLRDGHAVPYTGGAR